MPVRKALVPEIKQVHLLINEFARHYEMLPRSLSDLYAHVRDIFVFEKGGKILGVCALHVLWDDLAEIRSLAVKEGHQRKGIGEALVRKCVSEAGKLGVPKVFALTYVPEFFNKLGFEEVKRSRLPKRIWGDCINCHKFPDCDEHAMIKVIGE
ncbi:MAG: N-acetyltransferase [Actinomycetota bacterium]|nr:N-acetyltransferase [Actinomycetota bacterium]